ncbi:Cpr50Ca, partial [Drosophila busckii]
DMQRYFAQRNLRSMRQIDNPTDDSYLNAFNLHNEQPAQPAPGAAHSRAKREERQLPSPPRMLRFEVSDAVEPSAELKQLLRRHHERALKQNPSSSTTPATPPNKKRNSRRSKRATQSRQPANFKVEMIPFEATDAREPDAATAQLIKRARALDVQPAVATKPVEQPFKVRIRKMKRVKRSAADTAPQMFKFELSDAKTALPASLQRAAKQLSTNQTQATAATRLDDNMVVGGEATAETKRHYVYKEAPVTQLKSKKSISALPHEVQKVITQLMKEGHGGKAYVKFLPTIKSDFEHYKLYKPKAHGYGYAKYLPAKEHAPHVQVHIQPVPVVEQLRYVYKPQVSYAKLPAAQPQPIVVQDTPAPAEEVHHTYTAELEASAAPQFRASKPDPLQSEQDAPIYGTPIEHQQFEAEPQPTATPMIKIEYLAPADSFKEHYKQLPEFRELSTLIGKSPDDQIHGLTYLIAKEMQSKQRQPKLLLVDRPQDSTAPILFHPDQPAQPAPAPTTLKTVTVTDHGSLGVAPGRLIGMGKTKQYVPIVEPGNNDVKELPALPTKVPTPSSFIDFTPGHGLSLGYEGVHDEPALTTVEHVVHHQHQPTTATIAQHHHQQQQQQQLQHHHQHGLLATSLPAQLDTEKNGIHYIHSHSHSHDDKALQQYASKYAFGYRIRDFHTGNDFGHKQNRDLHGVTRGQYHILLPDGRVQNVIYHADDTGFHADVSFESGH